MLGLHLHQAFTMLGEDDQTLFVYLPARDRTSQDAWRLPAGWNAETQLTLNTWRHFTWECGDCGRVVVR